ncbi:hypothetical protein [Secundilactobacillus muriivasis]
MNDKDYFDLMQRAQRCRRLLNGTAVNGNRPHRKIRVDMAYCYQTVKEYVQAFNTRHTPKITVEGYLEADT